MFKLAQLTQKIKEKSETAFQHLKLRLTDRTNRQLPSPNLKNLKQKYLHAQLPQLQVTPSRNRIISNPTTQSRYKQGNRVHQNVSSGKMNSVQTKQLQEKRERLMSELKEIDIEMKEKHKQTYIQKIKRNKTQNQLDKKSYERAAQLIEKMNLQRKQMAEKKVKETIVLKQSVEQSIKYLKQMEEEKKAEQIKKKLEIQKRIQSRKLKAFERDKINRISNQVIKEINSYKVSLPDIYFKNYDTTEPKEEMKDVMITNVDQVEKKNFMKNRESRVTTFLQNVREEEETRKKISQQKRQYHKSVKERQVQFGNQLRVNHKLRIQRQKSQNKIHRPKRSPIRSEHNETISNSSTLNPNEVKTQINQALYQ